MASRSRAATYSSAHAHVARVPDRAAGRRADRGIRGGARRRGRRALEDDLHARLDAGHDERGSEVRTGLLTALQLLRDSFPDDPALDAAVSRALMLRVAARGAAGDAPDRATGTRGVREARRLPRLRGVRSGRRASTGSRRRCGWPAAGRRSSTTARWRSATPFRTRSRAAASTSASGDRGSARTCARAPGVDARVGEMPGEYCPGRYSVNAAARRSWRGSASGWWAAARTRAWCSWSRERSASTRCSSRSTPRSAWTGNRPSTARCARRSRAPWARVSDAIVTEYARDYDIVEPANWTRDARAGQGARRGAPGGVVRALRGGALPRALRVPRDRVHEGRPELLGMSWPIPGS